jgi:hypothetical protein
VHRRRLDVRRIVVDDLPVDAPAVADRELQAAEARRVEVGVVDLAERGLAQREPDRAVELPRRSEAVLVGWSPRREGGRGEEGEGEQGDGDEAHGRRLPGLVTTDP